MEDKTKIPYKKDEIFDFSDERPFSIDEMYGLSTGQFYRYYLDDEIYVEGQIVSNDGVTAIIRVTKRYQEAFFDILLYKEVRQFFPAFRDEEAERLTEYLCLDIETECNLFFRNPETDIIMLLHYDENYNFSLIPADIFKFRMERLKKKLIFELKKIEDAEKEKAANLKDPLINVELSDSAIDDMYKEYDKSKGNEEFDLNYSLNRSIHWLNNRNCAILSAWRGNYNRSENNKRNQELQKALRALGFGIIRLKGCYAEIGQDVEKENSYLIFDLNDSKDFLEKIYSQSEFYEQDCFLYKPVDEEKAYLIGTNDNFGKDKIEYVGVLHINKLNAEQYSEIGSGRLSFEKDASN